MKKFLKDSIRLLRKYNKLWLFAGIMLVAVYCLVMMVFFSGSVEEKIFDVLLASLNVCMAFDLIVSLQKRELFEVLYKQNTDLLNELNQSRHTVDQLKQALKKAQTELQEQREKPLVRTGYSQIETVATASPVEAASPVETGTPEEPKPKPKRRPAPKRKPKPKTENPDENKN